MQQHTDRHQRLPCSETACEIRNFVYFFSNGESFFGLLATAQLAAASCLHRAGNGLLPPISPRLVCIPAGCRRKGQQGRVHTESSLDADARAPPQNSLTRLRKLCRNPLKSGLTLTKSTAWLRRSGRARPGAAYKRILCCLQKNLTEFFCTKGTKVKFRKRENMNTRLT